MEKSTRIVTIMTDFGTANGYAASVKGVIKSLAPQTEVIDVTHQINPFNVREAAFTLLNYYNQFPKDTIHLVIVDPGVGSERLPVIIRTAHHYFVGPENGVFNFLLIREAYSIYEIQPEKVSSEPKSNTFHGRDLFGPVAAQLSNGKEAEHFGRKLDNRTALPNLYIRKRGEELEADCIAIDRFGNIITGISKHDLTKLKIGQIENIRIKGVNLSGISDYYSEHKEGEILALWNSLDFLEIAVYKGSAQQKLNFKSKTDKIILSYS